MLMKKILSVWLGLVVTALLAADNGVAPKPYGAVPSAAQLRWHEDEIISLVHFSTITYADKEWGDGDEPAALFNPTGFDARQIVKSAKDAGVKLLLLVTKPATSRYFKFVALHSADAPFITDAELGVVSTK